MASLLYQGIISLDGYLNDADGRFDWAMPDDEVHTFINGRERSVGTYLMGRRMYEVMKVWETLGAEPDLPPAMTDFAALWLEKDKVVYSRTLDAVSTARTRLERSLDPEAVRTMVAASPQDVSIAGAGLAEPAIRAGLVDEFHLFLVPTVVGGGTRFLPDGVRLDLELIEEHRFRGGFVFLRYTRRHPA